MTESAGRTVRRLTLRYPAVCSVCGVALSRGAVAMWDSETKTATCLACVPGEVSIDAGIAGASAIAEGERRKRRRVDEARSLYGDHAAHVAEQMAGRDPSIGAWTKGGSGESRLAEFIEREVGDRVIALHDRLIPGTRTNIDHLYVAPTGVWVVDAKAYKGKVVKRDVGPIWRTENKVYVNGRDRTTLAKAMDKQVEAVLAALRPDPEAKGHGRACGALLRRVGLGPARLPVPGRDGVGDVPQSAPKALAQGRPSHPGADGTTRESSGAVPPVSEIASCSPSLRSRGSSRKTGPPPR